MSRRGTDRFFARAACVALAAALQFACSNEEPAEPGPDAGPVVADAGGGQDAGGGADAGPTPDAGPADAGTGADAGSPPDLLWLTVLHHSDHESALLPDRAGVGGVAEFAATVQGLRAEAAAWEPPTSGADVVAKGSCLVAAGDNLLPGPAFQASLDRGAPFYDAVAMDRLGYDAIGLGNHDFDFGPQTLADFVTSFSGSAPWVTTNLSFTGAPALQALVTSGRIARSAVFEVAGVQVGVVADTTPDLPQLSSATGVQVQPVAQSVNAEVAALQQRGVDIVVLLSHLQALANDKALVPALHGVDIVISGGGHELLATTTTTPPLHAGDASKVVDKYPVWVDDADGVKVPIVTANALYRYVGRLVAKFDVAAGRLLAIDEARSGPVRVLVADLPDGWSDEGVPGGLVDDVSTPVKDAADDLAQSVVGTTEVPLDGLRNHVRARETNEGDLVADALLWQAKQLGPGAGVPAASIHVAIQNGGGIRNDSVVPVGNLTELTLWNILPFANFVAVTPNVSWARFKELMENAVSKVEIRDGRFAQIAGFTLVYDGGRTAQVVDSAGTVTTAGTRVRELRLDDGTYIVRDGQVQAQGGTPGLGVATIDFMARGGDGYPFGGAAFQLLNSTYQAALLGYLQGPLAGVVRAADYPVGGERRIVAANVCGNGLVETHGATDAQVVEACDDGSVEDGDGCSNKCKVEPGWACSGAPSTCVRTCGNNVLDAGEECDDGTTDGGDGCKACESEITLVSLTPATAELLADGGTGVLQLKLSGPAPVRGLRVAITGANADVLAPAFVLVAQGLSRAGFEIEAAATQAAGPVTLRASLGKTSLTAAVSVVTAALAPVAGDLVLNEVAFDPAGSSATDRAGDYNCDGVRDGADDEFVEIVNVSGKTLDLEDVSLWDQARWEGTTTPALDSFGAGSVLGPGEMALVFGGADIDTVGTVDSGPWCEDLLDAWVFWVGPPTALSLNNADNGGDTLRITAGTQRSSAVLATAAWTSAATADQSWQRSPDVTGDFASYGQAAGHLTDRSATPGTWLDGVRLYCAVP